MAVVTISSGIQGKKKNLLLLLLFPLLFAIKWWDWMPWSSFFESWILNQPFHSPLSPSSRDSLVPLRFLPLEWYHLHIWGCWYFSWQKLNKQGDNVHPWCTSFPIFNQSIVANRWGNNGNSERLFFGALKSLQMVTAAMKLLLGSKAMINLDSILKSRDITLPTKVPL